MNKLKAFLHLSILFLVLISTLFLVLPTIYNHINDPNAIVYFNNDEGYQMDLIWSYYSGEIRPSYAGNVDYGLELVYIADFCRLFFSGFIDFTPGLLVVIMRWLHLVGWLSALIAFWLMVGRHFNRGWQRSAATLLLAVHPAFAYFSANNKPDFLVLLFMIIGLDYALRLVDLPSKKALLISVASAAIAVIIKFSGFFLLPAIVAALYFGKGGNGGKRGVNSSLVPHIQNAWIYYIFLMMMAASVPLLAIFSYVRSSTSLTFYQEFGFVQSFLKFKLFFFIWILCLGGVFFSIFFFIISKKRPSLLERWGGMTNTILSDGLIVFVVFSAAMSIFGFRWFLTPAHLINTYVQNGLDFSGGFMIREFSTAAGFMKAYLSSLVKRFVSFDMIILSLFGMYLLMEFFFEEKEWKKKGLSFKPDQMKKRFVLIIYLVPFLLSMFTPGRFTHYHALPFFAAIYILIFEGMEMAMFALRNYYRGWMSIFFGGLAKVVLTLLVLFDISVNARRTVRERVGQFHQREDVSFEISEWWRRQIPPEEKVVTDHMTRVYVPPGHKNIWVFKGYQADRLEQLQSIVKENRPRYLYYNEGTGSGEAFPSIGEMIPGQKVRLVRLFESKGRSPQGRKYQRRKGDRFLIYELIY